MSAQSLRVASVLYLSYDGILVAPLGHPYIDGSRAIAIYRLLSIAPLLKLDELEF